MKVQGLPTDRPVCQNCQKKLRYWTTYGGEPRQFLRWRGYGVSDRGEPRQFLRWRGYGVSDRVGVPLFCTLRCSLGFAVAAHRMGARRFEQKGGGK